MKSEWESHRIERAEEWLARLARAKFAEQIKIDLEFAPAEPFLPFEKIPALPFRPVPENQVWGTNGELGWFKIAAKIPADWNSGNPVALLVNVNGELLLFNPDGVPVYSLTAGSIFMPRFRHELFTLEAKPGDNILCFGEATAATLFGVERPVVDSGGAIQPGTGPFPEEEKIADACSSVKFARLVSLRPELYDLERRVALLIDQARSLPENHERRKKLSHTLCDAVGLYDSGKLAECTDLIQACFAAPENHELEFTAIGHAHIDTAWLWHMEESIRKCGRTFARQLANIKKYPEYIFGASAPFHYDWTEKYYPALFEQIKEQVAAGRWECLGVMWVEADCNISGGEALARQLLYGKRYFMQKFGVDVNHLWLPDVFGYSACLPQLLQSARVSYFMTIKISWNRYNQFPFTSFRWKGIDGSEVLTHLPPTGNYNEQLIPSRLSFGRDNCQEKETAPLALAAFGIGDGGGGPTEEFIEDGLLMKNLAAAPRVRFGTAAGFFEKLDRYSNRLPEWNGELYLELHRGTLTSQAKIKAGNRQTEHRLRDTEILFALFAPEIYPQEKLEALWKKFLSNQFHDVLPGSSIAGVAEDTLNDYAEINRELDELWQSAAPENSGAGFTVVNSLNFRRSDIVRLPSASPVETAGKILPAQTVGNELWIQLEQPGLASTVLTPAETPAPEIQTRELTAADFPLTLENEHALYQLNENGAVLFAQDRRTGKIFIENEAANELALYADYPVKWDAWDIDPFYPDALIDTAHAAGTAALETGAVAQILNLKLAVGNSIIQQRIILPETGAALEVENQVQWNETHRLLRVNVPVAVKNKTAGFNIQFGVLHRSTENNTSEEQAQFEVAAHEYTDLSEADSGVALLNAGKYGHKIKGSVISMSLLRAPAFPDPDADRGEHCFRYAIVPHAGNLAESDVAEQGAIFNQPRWILAGKHDFKFPFAIDGNSIRLETIKKAEDSDDLILRLYECKGNSGTAEMKFRCAVNAAEVNLLEEPIKCLGNFPEDSVLNLPFRPFEIKTIQLTQV
ncbi:MAG: glycoside hydrolase family 38 C-terminal domain-containing protein [Kiritimatiellales bacterium]